MFDSALIAALLLLASSLCAALSGTGVYLRFAAMLGAALAAAFLAPPLLPGLFDMRLAAAVALPVLPLAGVGLGLCAIARCLGPMPPLPATLALAVALAGGIAALLGASLLFALLPLLLGGLAVTVAALHRAALCLLLAGMLLMAAAAAFLARGVALPGVMLLAAALAGFAAQTRASNSRAAFGPAAP
jgi:hypothetical protein